MLDENGFIKTKANRKIDKSADSPLTYYFIYDSRERVKRANGPKMKVKRKNKQKRRKKFERYIFVIKTTNGTMKVKERMRKRVREKKKNE